MKRLMLLTLLAGSTFGQGVSDADLKQLFLNELLYAEIPAGSFRMGSDKSPDEMPIRTVTFSKAFLLGKYEVTQAQWLAVMGENPSRFKDPERPVEMVTFADAKRFIGILNKRLGGPVFRLPSEAEWEYACRAGRVDDAPANFDESTWYKANAGGRSQPVGRKRANAWGLHDMTGNLWEWVEDWYASDYKGLAKTDPRGPERGKHHIIRGGDWDGDAGQCRCAFRGNDQHGGKGPRDVYGFRLVFDPSAIP